MTAVNRLASQQARAKLLYFQYRDFGDICKETGVTKQTLHNWITGQGQLDRTKAWDFQRERQTSEILTSIKQRMHNQIGEVFSKALPLITKSLDRLAEKLDSDEDAVLWPKAIKELTDAILNFDKLQRLEAGKPTDITEVQYGPITIEDLRKAIGADKFMEIPMEKGKDYHDEGRSSQEVGPGQAVTRGTPAGSESGGR